MSLPSVTVLLGGPSAEREVSLRSGAAVARALRSLGFDVAEVDPAPGRLGLPSRVDVVFIALHGTWGEDGGVQADLDALGVPYTGCDAAASRLAFDKVATKRRLLAQGVPTARYTVVGDAAQPWPSDAPQPPLVVKPARQGSSVGLGFVNRAEELEPALRAALRFDSEALVEERIPGREVTVGILGREALPVVEVRPREGQYDYDNKYTAGRTDYFCPAPFPEEVTAAVQAAGLGAFHSVGARDYARVDIIVRPDGNPVVLEVNTLPGMTETSLLPKAAAAAGIPFPELCRRMVNLALARPAPKP